MVRFKYRFEKILSYKRHLEKQKQRDLAIEVQKEQAQKQKIDDLRRDRGEQHDRERALLVGEIRPAVLTGFTRYNLLLKQMELAGHEALNKIGQEVTKRRTILLEAARQRKIYEKLKERHKEKYDKENELILQKENDENGQKIFFRNR